MNTRGYCEPILPIQIVHFSLTGTSSCYCFYHWPAPIFFLTLMMRAASKIAGTRMLIFGIFGCNFFFAYLFLYLLIPSPTMQTHKMLCCVYKCTCSITYSFIFLRFLFHENFEFQKFWVVDIIRTCFLFTFNGWGFSDIMFQSKFFSVSVVFIPIQWKIN